jgi:type II secretory pathway component GspD/PulD (secretin)
LGGLRQDNSSKSFTKVPILGDLPGIGLAFRKEEKGRDKKDLVIFVTPTILQSGDFQKSQKPGEFLQQKMEQDKPDEEWSAWDSGKPVDWTKPDNTVEPLYSPKNPTKW